MDNAALKVINLEDKKKNENSLDFLEEVLKKNYNEVKELQDLFTTREMLLDRLENIEDIEKSFYSCYEDKLKELCQDDNVNLKSEIREIIYEIMVLLNNKNVLEEIMNEAQLYWNKEFINNKERVIKIYYLLKRHIDMLEYIEDTNDIKNKTILN